MSEPHAERDYLKRPFRVAHLSWAGIGVAASVFLIFFGGEGHPPGIVLLPVVWVVWVLGHGVLWAVRRLAARGRMRALYSDDGGRGWPAALILAAVGTGTTTAVGLFPLAVRIFESSEGRFRDPLWAIMIAIWLAHGVCFVGLLMRRAWSRTFVALLCFGWAALLVAQFVDHLARGSRIQPGELVISVVLIAIGVLFGWHLLVSRDVKDFLASPARTRASAD